MPEELTVKYRSLPPEGKEAYVAERKAASTEKYMTLRARQAALNVAKKKQKALYHSAYTQFVQEFDLANSVQVFTVKIHPYHDDKLTIVMQRSSEEGGTVYKAAFSICSPKESFDLRKGVAVAAYRLYEELSGYFFKISVGPSGSLRLAHLAELCGLQVSAQLTLRTTSLPKHLVALRIPGESNFLLRVTPVSNDDLRTALHLSPRKTASTPTS